MDKMMEKQERSSSSASAYTTPPPKVAAPSPAKPPKKHTPKALVAPPSEVPPPTTEAAAHAAPQALVWAEAEREMLSSTGTPLEVEKTALGRIAKLWWRSWNEPDGLRRRYSGFNSVYNLLVFCIWDLFLSIQTFSNMKFCFPGISSSAVSPQNIGEDQQVE